MLLTICATFDKVSKTYENIQPCNNIACYIRENVKWLVRVKPLRDLIPCEIGKFNPDTGEIEAMSIIEHSWEEYKLPENKAEALSPLGSSVAEVVSNFNEKTADISKD